MLGRLPQYRRALSLQVSFFCKTGSCREAQLLLPAGAASAPLKLTYLQQRCASHKTEVTESAKRPPCAASEAEAQQESPSIVIFVSPDEKMQLPCSYRPGTTLLSVAFENGIDMEGACGGRCGCSTCHVILSPKDFEKFPEAEVEETDLLEVAPGSEAT
ncbi:2Fe-2S iron-sulfur cluster binding domain-containing protein [Cyclospora cayetanensis]|uniref:2Fe-2S iron-sulfur cluster binding domain-containing protein n=1 Tax=Cyclospora cayetanensis TaxID=88456 RepID=A0A1D3CTF1_9EIME|nr:2Fe-2S iron-sulfur cluster binding domain-containing protein [Cyclospora cayetanensis]